MWINPSTAAILAAAAMMSAHPTDVIVMAAALSLAVLGLRARQRRQRWW